MELSTDEIQLLKNYREQKEKERRNAEASFILLKTAYEYAVFLRNNGIGSSFSTFCNDFGFDNELIMDRGEFYKLVEHIRSIKYAVC